jgi:DNA-binding transcriptional LysR family regulator
MCNQVLFYEHCRQALAAINTAETLLDSGKLEASGRLRVSVPALFGHHCITPLLTEFALEHSGLKLEISFNDRTVDLVGEGFDLAIRIGSLPDSSSLIARKLGAHGMIFWAAPSYLAQHGAPQTIEELSRADAIGYIQSGIVRKWLVRDKKRQAATNHAPGENHDG